MNQTTARTFWSVQHLVLVTLLPGDALTAGTVLGRIGASGKFRALTPSAHDGAQVAAAVLLRDAGASESDRFAEIPLQADVRGEAVVWPEGMTDEQKTKALGELRARNIRVRR